MWREVVGRARSGQTRASDRLRSSRQADLGSGWKDWPEALRERQRDRQADRQRGRVNAQTNTQREYWSQDKPAAELAAGCDEIWSLYPAGRLDAGVPADWPQTADDWCQDGDGAPRPDGRTDTHRVELSYNPTRIQVPREPFSVFIFCNFFTP